MQYFLLFTTASADTLIEKYLGNYYSNSFRLVYNLFHVLVRV